MRTFKAFDMNGIRMLRLLIAATMATGMISCSPEQIQSVKLIGSNEKITFKQTNDKLMLDIPANRPNKYAAVFIVQPKTIL